MKLLHWLIINLIFFFSGCIGIKKAAELKPYIQEADEAVYIESHARDSLLIQYLGCGGFFIRAPNQAVMIDPFFSYLGPLALLPFKKLNPDTLQMDRFFRRHFTLGEDREGIIKTILVSHSHYDHLFDVPYIFHRYLNSDSTQIMGSLSTEYLLKLEKIGNAFHPGSVVNLNWTAWRPFHPLHFIYSRNGKIRILPIIAAHAPHIGGIKLISQGPPKKKLPHYPHRILKFPEGTNFTFLIDFLDDKQSVEFRILVYSGSAATPPAGFPPKVILAEKSVDVLLLCVASFHQVKEYPEALIKHINPTHIILSHWENFFKNQTKLQTRPMTLPQTSVKDFIKELERILREMPDAPNWSMPNIGASTKFFIE